MFHVVLVTPEIPPNTGNDSACANSGAKLHLSSRSASICPSAVAPRGMDYAESCVTVHPDPLPLALGDARVALTTKGSSHCDSFSARRRLRFRFESRGLSAAVLADIEQGHRLRLP